LHRLARFAAVFTVLLAVGVATAIAPAGATSQSPPPKIEHCWWWPGDTVAHWDWADLFLKHDMSYVKQVWFFWPGSAEPVKQGHIEGGNARAQTPLFAGPAYAQLVMSNGTVIQTNTVGCVLH
jgi:hypothetical protein